MFHTTIADNIRYGYGGDSGDDYHGVSMDVVEAAAKAAHAHEFILDLPQGYATIITPSSLSGGQKQRIAIARALIKEPKILILDEATATLDTKSEEAIQNTLRSLSMKEKRMTVIVIAHRLSTIQTCASIAVLQDGRIVEVGTYEALHRDGTAFHGLVTSLIIEDTKDNK